MSTFTNKKLARASLTTTLDTYYTVPGATTTIVTVITLSNSNTSTARTVSVKIGGKFILASYLLATTETLSLSDPHVLATTETIQAQQDVGTDVDLNISGVEIT